MKAYLFVSQVVYKYDDCGIDIETFSTREDARNALAEWRDEEYNFLIDSGWTVETDEPDCFEIFLDGDWCCNHSCGYVKEISLTENKE